MVRLATTPPRQGHDGVTRAALLRRGGLAAAALVSGGRAPYAFAGPLRYRGRQLGGSLTIVQWTHVIGGFDTWLAGWPKNWGTLNDVAVTVDHISITRLPALVADEVAAQKGHDIVGFLTPPTAYRDQVIDHGAIVRAVERGSARMARWAGRAPTTRGGARTSASPTRTSRRRCSGGTTSGTRSASRPRRGSTSARRPRR